MTKLRSIRLKEFSAATTTELETAINDWLHPPDNVTPPPTDEELVDVWFDFDGTVYYCFLTYTEA